MWIVRVVFIIGHSVVNINALMVEQFCIGHHCSVLEILAEASGNQMYVNPSDVLRRKDVHIEVFRVFFCN